MGRKYYYTVTKEDAEDITEFKKWVDDLLKKKKEPVRTKNESSDFDQLDQIFDFSLSMQPEVKVPYLQKTEEVELTKVSDSKEMISARKDTTEEPDSVFDSLSSIDFDEDFLLHDEFQKDEFEFDEFDIDDLEQ